MERILELRKKVTEIDKKILFYLKERVDFCRSIGAIKRDLGIPIRDYEREEEIYSNIVMKASELKLELQEIRSIFKEIISLSTKAQETNTKT